MTRPLIAAGVVLLAAAGAGGDSVRAQVFGLPPGAAIAGRVVDAQSGRALERVVVEVSGGTITRRVAGDVQGRFLITGLPDGDYTVRAERTGYLPAFHGQRRATGEGLVLPLVGGQWLGSVDVALWRPAAITGDVRDDVGEPLEGITVRAYRHQPLAERTTLQEVARAVTDDEGRYRLHSLAPGEHVVGISVHAGDFKDESARPDYIFAPMYYPAAEMMIGASRVTVEAGREWGGVGFMLQTVPGVDVSGQVDVSDLDATQVSRLRLHLARPLDPGVTEPPEHRVLAVATVDASGHFHFADVPSGHFVIESTFAPTAAPLETTAGEDAPRDDRVLWSNTPLWVGRESLADVTVELRPGLSVQGQVQSAGRSQRPPLLPDTFRVHFEPLFTTAGVRPVVAMLTGPGEFRTPDALVPGRYLVRVSGLPQAMSVRSIVSGGVDVSDRTLDLTPGYSLSDLTVELTDRPTVVSGTVKGSSIFGDPDSLVLLFPRDARLGGVRRIRSVRVNAGGGFVLTDIPAGSYFIVAIDDAEADGWQDRDRREALGRKATVLTLRDGESRIVELRRVSAGR